MLKTLYNIGKYSTMAMVVGALAIGVASLFIKDKSEESKKEEKKEKR